MTKNTLQLVTYGPALLARFCVVMLSGAVLTIIAGWFSQAVAQTYYTVMPREYFFDYESVRPHGDVMAGDTSILFESRLYRREGLDFSYLETLYCDTHDGNGYVDISGAQQRYLRQEMEAATPEKGVLWRLNVNLPDVVGTTCYGRATPEVVFPYNVRRRQVVLIDSFVLK